jgi:hypothetical protein
MGASGDLNGRLTSRCQGSQADVGRPCAMGHGSGVLKRVHVFFLLRMTSLSESGRRAERLSGTLTARSDEGLHAALRSACRDPRAQEPESAPTLS